MAILIVVIAVLMFRLNRPTPWVVDDILKGEGAKKLHTFQQYFEHIWGFYFSWGGRIWGELFAYLFLSIPKRVFDIVNTIGYLAFTGLIYINITGKFKSSPSLFLLINFLLFACLPAFGQDILWISGTANYMWASIIPLLYLAFWRRYFDQEIKGLNRIPSLMLLFILAVLSGWANENVSVSLIFLAICYMVIYRNKYGSIPRFATSGLIGLVIGTLLLWLAPGNFARFAAEKHSKSILHIVHNVFHNISVLFDFNSTLLLILLFAVLIILGRSAKKSLSSVFMISGVLSAVAMSVVGGIYTRTFLGCVVLMIISVGMLYDDWNDTVNVRKCRAMLLVCLCLGMHIFYVTARDGINDYANAWNQNLEIIRTEKEKGNLDVYVNPITPKNKFCATYGLDDIKPKENNQHWLNTGVAHAFGLHTIQSVHVNPQK
ncbi:DUF6056 family protein [Mitsuokella sp. AF21-1AC]|uniref:DUF3329 domain-containing protein n=1 Tax=Mitsuokella sp. AF21-1AC TaxID=2292235 RepID=UPI0011CB1BBE|nr:DUF6056 family protein [Mitsuokella sp. AF21-1AC]